MHHANALDFRRVSPMINAFTISPVFVLAVSDVGEV